MREDIKQLNMYAANVFSSILAQNPNAISMTNRDRLVAKSFEIAQSMVDLDNPKPNVEHGDYISDEVAEAFAKKDALLKMLLAGIFGSDMEAMNMHYGESELVDEAIAVIAGLREDADLLNDATTRANTLERELNGILHEFHDDREDDGDNLSSDFIKENKVGTMNVGPATAVSCSIGGNKLDTDKPDVTIQKAPEASVHPTIDGSEREWQEFVKRLELAVQAEKRYG